MIKKIGDEVVITKNTCYHNFRIGEKIVVTEVVYVENGDYYYYCGNDLAGISWCFKNEDIS